VGQHPGIVGQSRVGQLAGIYTSFVKLQIAKPVTAVAVEIYFPGGIRLFFHKPVSDKQSSINPSLTF
jgi:hypothetical protein